MWSVSVGVALSACCLPAASSRPDVPMDVPDAPIPRADVPWDAGFDTPDAARCDDPGRSGYPCGEHDVCVDGLTCRTSEPRWLNDYGIRVGEPDPDAPGFFRAAAVPRAEEAVPLSLFSGSVCSAPCDVRLEAMERLRTEEFDTCGPCAACVARSGYPDALPTWELLREEERVFGEHTGVCRANCVFNPATRGRCAAGTTCDPATLVCIEACVSDVQCQVSLEPTRSGGRVSVLDPSRGTCNLVTGRCVSGGGSMSVGRLCEHRADCSLINGVCLEGGTCGEVGCGEEDRTGDFLCDGARGVCLYSAPDRATVCVQGCQTAAQCNPGNTCVPTYYEADGSPGLIDGRFTGVCRPTCDEVPSDPDGDGPLGEADDRLVVCGVGERCAQAADDAARPDRDGRCRPVCTGDAMCPGVAAGERCEIPAGSTDGFCAYDGQRCSAMALDADCHFGQRCDLLDAPGPEGRCVDGCASDVDCGGGRTCATDRGVCRRACDSGCGEDERCELGLCEQRTAPSGA